MRDHRDGKQQLLRAATTHDVAQTAANRSAMSHVPSSSSGLFKSEANSRNDARICGRDDPSFEAEVKRDSIAERQVKYLKLSPDTFLGTIRVNPPSCPHDIPPHIPPHPPHTPY